MRVKSGLSNRKLGKEFMAKREIRVHALRAKFPVNRILSFNKMGCWWEVDTNQPQSMFMKLLLSVTVPGGGMQNLDKTSLV